MNPLIIVRHGARPQLEHRLNQTGISQAKKLGIYVINFFPNSFKSIRLFYGDDENGSFKGNYETSSLAGNQFGIQPVRKELFAADPFSGSVSKDKLEQMALFFEEEQKNGPVFIITSDRVISSFVSYIDNRYKFNLELNPEFISFASGYLFDFLKNDILYFPSGTSVR